MDGREVNMPNTGSRRGGWITFTFITGAAAGLTLATGGWLSNLIVYLIQEFNVKSINAAQISNIMNGCINLFPVIGAIVADSFIGSFFVASISACISLMGIVLLELTATLDSLRPQSCDDGSSLCTPPSKLQYAILYTALALACIGCGCTRFTLATMGANQFDKPNDQGRFFDWYFFTFYTSSAVSSTVIVYIEDNLSWRLGFGLSAIANFIGLAFLLLGNRFYLHVKPHGSPFTGLIRVIVATIRKRKVQLSSKTEDYYYGQNGIAEIPPPSKKRFRFLNRAALKTEGDVQWDGSVAKPWRICTMQQVEDLRNLMRILPLWSTGVFLSTPIGILSSLAILQALTMDRSFGPHFKIPSGSILVLVLIWTSISLTIIDRFLCPMWQKLTGSSPTPLQRIGVGHVLNTLSMLTSALVESKRLKIAHAHHLRDQPSSIVPMSVLWLVPQLALVGIGEAFHFPGQVALYYQEFPTSLKTTSTAMISTIIGIAYYLSTALIDLVRRVTGWLPDNLNDGRVDNVYWALVVVGVLNFGYYLMCACSYRYQNVGKGSEDAALINDADS
ncbi:protein NRT1/ PTR FAMILY 2.7-like isoform X1 [Juglans microcarpa x Juglans regia]|uniref:protein NRT1/ PTR FAMILY 2.7-like isoform X1 n=1 Tax=Juglans microcarpa x Juglans regia TaxID=2249226 RepID=UPI001B7F3B94|nr:protein NRT1/ PTR FAMILY 2.7-like isoform X1 [Juglans microcarpa x Juglans regia]